MLNLTRLFTRVIPLSEYFDQKDRSEVIMHYESKITDKRYTKLKYKWQEVIKKKAERRERKALENANRTRTPDQDSKFIVHNPRQPIEVPCNPDAVFAVIEIAGRQFKVTKDDLVISEWIKDVDINQTIELQNVLMIGTQDYTSLGRPFVQSAKVYATVEQQALSEKEIVFKKNRRKRYRKSQGHRQNITVLRINEILHQVTDSELKRAVSLI